ncbi:hypothetical protein V8C43DRAFT_17908 [Trichoderma afarasin]
MEISISESLKGPSCTMAAILITLPSHPSIPVPIPISIQFHPYIQIPVHLYPSQFPPPVHPSFHLFLPPNSKPITNSHSHSSNPKSPFIYPGFPFLFPNSLLHSIMLDSFAQSRRVVDGSFSHRNDEPVHLYNAQPNRVAHAGQSGQQCSETTTL